MDKTLRTTGPSGFGGIDSRPDNFVKGFKKKKPDKIELKTLQAMEKKNKALHQILKMNNIFTDKRIKSAMSPSKNRKGISASKDDQIKKVYLLSDPNFKI